jgi:uncharacterized repeat protein (TIGR02543 family)
LTGSEETTITINLGGGNSNARAAYPEQWPPADFDLLDYINYDIILTGSGQTIEFTADGNTAIKRTIAAGNWNVKIDAHLEGAETPDTPNGQKMYYATGTKDFQVIAGVNNTVTIQMNPICLVCKEYPCIADCECDNCGITQVYPFIVTFDNNGGEGEIAQLIADENGNIMLPDGKGLIKIGHIFIGWITEPDNDDTPLSGLYTPTGNITLYAKWIDAEIVYPLIVHFNSNGGSGSIPSRTVDENGEVNLPAGNEVTMTRTGYTFIGWTIYGDDTLLPSVYTPSDNITLFAKWESVAATHTVTFVANTTMTADNIEHGRTIKQNDIPLFKYESEFNEPGDVPITYGTIEGWYNEETRITKFNFNTPITTDTTLFAKMNLTLEIGDTGPAGGKIFYVNENGFTVHGYGEDIEDEGYFATYTAYYLEAALFNESNSARMNELAIMLPETPEGGIGFGRRNTQSFVKWHKDQGQSGRAAQICKNKNLNGEGGQNFGWFLPNREELQQLYFQKVFFDITDGTYWSSTRIITSYFYLDFSAGSIQGANGSGYRNVRAIRAF